MPFSLRSPLAAHSPHRRCQHASLQSLPESGEHRMSAMELAPAILSPERVLENAHALMSAAMIDAKRARMRAEGERQMLANRLSRLQAEELRATKRIEETHRRTMEILAAKNRHQQHAEQKEQLRLEQEQMIEQHRQELNRIREERKEAMRQATLATRQAMQEQVRAQKEISARAASEVAYMREVEQEMAIFKRNAVRQGEAQARERKMREKELMIAHLQQRAEERRREEELRTHLYDQNLAELERQEYELILSLQKQRVRVRQWPLAARAVEQASRSRSRAHECMVERGLLLDPQEEHHNVYRELEKEMGGRNDEGGLDDSNVFLTRIPS